MRVGEVFAGQVCDPVTEMIVTRCDKTAPFTVKVMAYENIGIAAVTVMREVCGI